MLPGKISQHPRLRGSMALYTTGRGQFAARWEPVCWRTWGLAIAWGGSAAMREFGVGVLVGVGLLK